VADETDSDLYAKGFEGFRTSFEPGEKVTGTVTAITKDFVFVNISSKSEGIVARQDLVDDEGDLTIAEGDPLSAFYVRTVDGEIELTVRMRGSDELDQSLVDAFAARIPIEGRVEAERKGGYDVQVGSQRAFCPYSQIDVFRGGDSAEHVGKRYTFLLTECGDGNVVVSRRQFIEHEQTAQRDSLRESLSEGDIVAGTVRRLMPFGAFIDIGGVEGLCPMRELAWERVDEAGDVVREGEKLAVKVLRVDWDAEKFTLSIRQAGRDPWEGVEGRYQASKLYDGKVTRLMPFGAFVALEPGVEGLVHISKLGAGKRLNHASEVLAEDEPIAVYVESIDLERRRISLTLENPQQGRTMEVEGLELTVGAEMTGVVQDVRQFGVFVSLSPSQTGLLHISEISFNGNVDRFRDMRRRFQRDAEVEVVVKNVHGDRISLTLPGGADDDDSYRQDVLESPGEADALGDLGSAFDSLKL
jgi:small subunit ribosomal protein S1